MIARRRILGDWARGRSLKSCAVTGVCQKFHYFEICIMPTYAAERGIYEVSEAMLRMASAFLLKKKSWG